MQLFTGIGAKCSKNDKKYICPCD